MSVTIKLRGNTEAYWQSANPVPADREVILSTDKNNFKVGDGITDWATLPYYLATGLADLVTVLNGNLGVNYDSPDRPLHIVGPDGLVPNRPSIGAKDLLVFENNTNANITLIGGVNSASGLKVMESGESSFSGAIIYYNSLDVLSFFTKGTSNVYATLNSEGLSLVPGINKARARLDVGPGALQIEEMTAPASPAANNVRIYAKDNGSGKTQLCAKFSDGTETILATQP